MTRFELGQIVVTRNIYYACIEDPEFYMFVKDSLELYRNCDWGNTCAEDAAQNNAAVLNGEERILAVYNYPKYEENIWIITEWDRSATTVLFPSDY